MICEFCPQFRSRIGSVSVVDDQLLAFLRERDVACPDCGYNLRGLTSDRCPECGLELCLTIGSTAPWLAAWLTMVVSTCLTGGIGLLLWGFVLRHGWVLLATRSLEKISLCMFFGGPVLAIAALLLRRPFLGLTSARQWLIAWISIGYSVTAVVLHTLVGY